MAKIKIDQTGYDSFDGFLGTLEFKGGISVREPTPREIQLIGANIKIVRVDTDEQVGPAINMVGTRNVSAVVETPLPTESEKPKTEAKTLKYSESDLEEIAGNGGIKALRKVAEEFDVKGTSISEIIKEILEAQNKA